MHTQPGGSGCCRPCKVGFKIWLSFSLIQLDVCIINSVNFPPTHSACATVVLNFAAGLLRQQVSKCVEILQIKLTHLHMPNKIFIHPRGECIAYRTLGTESQSTSVSALWHFPSPPTDWLLWATFYLPCLPIWFAYKNEFMTISGWWLPRLSRGLYWFHMERGRIQ